jgi:hypothetical protein
LSTAPLNKTAPSIIPRQVPARLFIAHPVGTNPRFAAAREATLMRKSPGWRSAEAGREADRRATGNVERQCWRQIV